MTLSPAELSELIRLVPDFPKPGIQFKDITPLLKHPQAFKSSITHMAELFKGETIHAIAAPEARGFIFGTCLAVEMGCGFLPIRKPNKLPYETKSHTYDLEYGTDTVEMHTDAVGPGDRVLIVDDVLATGGTMAACAELVTGMGGSIVGCGFLLELGFLKGREKLKDHRIEVVLPE